MVKEYLPQKCLVFDSYEAAADAQKILLDNNYCVLITREENLFCLNWIWSENSDRRDVLFMNREDYDWEWDKFCRCHPEIDWTKEGEE